jgi:hypothetical protein
MKGIDTGLSSCRYPILASRAMISRMISLLPAPIVMAPTSRYILAIGKHGDVVS